MTESARETGYEEKAREAAEIRARLPREVSALRERPKRAAATLRRVGIPIAIGLAILAIALVAIAYRRR